ncbi:hypothetical protein [Streptomyces zaomyceticus]|uniref:hypothetical protein n=1 Tax=Streptomyces zaomyceticus TaxID=68286 RepID=UPI003689CBED
MNQTNFSEFSDPDFEDGWTTTTNVSSLQRAAALHAAADQVALELTPTGPAALGYRHAITDVVRLLRRLGDEEATR